jgi:hypothetical protein
MEVTNISNAIAHNVHSEVVTPSRDLHCALAYIWRIISKVVQIYSIDVHVDTLVVSSNVNFKFIFINQFHSFLKLKLFSPLYVFKTNSILQWFEIKFINTTGIRVDGLLQILNTIIIPYLKENTSFMLI